MRIPLSAPDIDEQDIAAVSAVLRTPQLSIGPVQERFEQEFTNFIGSEHAVAVSSGTAGLHVCLLALGIGPGDEVIVPSFTFIAAANAVRYVAATPVFVDIEADTLNMDPACVERAVTPRTRALMIVHTFGLPAAMDALLAIAARYGLRVIEDACEAIGAEYRGRKVGALGDVGIFAFYPNKQITTGEGGMVVTNLQAVAKSARALRNQGRTGGDWFEHTFLGYNYRLPEMSCALGLSQLRRIEQTLAMRARVASLYDERLRVCPQLILPRLHPPEATVSWFVYVMRLAKEFTRAQRDEVIVMLTEQGIGCGRYFAPIHRQGAYRDAPTACRSLPITDTTADRIIALPFFNRMTREQVAEVSGQLIEAVGSVVK